MALSQYTPSSVWVPGVCIFRDAVPNLLVVVSLVAVSVPLSVFQPATPPVLTVVALSKPPLVTRLVVASQMPKLESGGVMPSPWVLVVRVASVISLPLTVKLLLDVVEE